MLLTPQCPSQGWQKVAGTKKVNRYMPPAVKAAETQLELATERLQLAAGKAWTGFLGEFAGWYAPMRAAVAALAALDCLHSLAAVAANAGCALLADSFLRFLVQGT